ncbi:hypothetical protein SUDANB180_00160 [Streptomyces sp. enrichment culture]
MRFLHVFVPDVHTRRFRPGLRVKRVRQTLGVYAITWSMGPGSAGAPHGNTDPPPPR